MIRTTQLERLGLFDAKVPRYTSYPTAPHFSADISASDVRNWITEIPRNTQISLYIHIPFCRRLCWFCACRTQGLPNLSPLTGYIERLKKELALIRSSLPRGLSLGHLHLGGGTPTILNVGQIKSLMAHIFDTLPLSKNVEISVEIDPTEVDAERIAALAEIGMTRASIGIQDFDPDIQAAIGRIQGFDTTKRAFDLLRSAGIRSLNADLVYGLPMQTSARLTETLHKLLSLAPDRIALFGYAHVPWMARRQKLIDQTALPNPQARLRLFQIAQQIFKSDGYESIGIDHFALPNDTMTLASLTGKLFRNFQGYTTDASKFLIGVGASAISKFPQGYAQNAAVTSEYSKLIDTGDMATVRGHKLTNRDRLNSDIIAALLCQFKVRIADICENHDIQPAAVLELFERVNMRFENLLQVTETGLIIPSEARPLTRMIAREFDQYNSTQISYSAAI